MGFRSPSRSVFVESTDRWVSRARLCSVLSISHALGGFLLHKPCGLISSHYHVRDFTSGVFPGNHSGCLSVVRTLLSLAPLGSASPSGFCSDCRSVVSTRSGVFKCSLDPLLRFRYFGSFSEHLESAFAPSPLLTLPLDTSQSHRRWSSAYQSMFSLSSCPQRVLPVRDL